MCVVVLQVAEALQERAQRIYDKYGTLMLNVDGFTAEGVERKATCRALFSKLLYLTEHEPLVAQGSEAFKTTDLRMVRVCCCGWVGCGSLRHMGQLLCQLQLQQWAVCFVGA
jgi:hypothetical protein